MARQNKALEQTKHGSGGPALRFDGSRAIIIKSCFAAQRQRSMAESDFKSELQQFWSWP